MHIDWQWAKQRPHFIAEKLIDTGLVDIDLFFVRNMKESRVKNSINKKLFKSVNIIYKVPFSAEVFILSVFEQIINHRKISNVYSDKYDYIWITSPFLLQLIDIEKVKAKVIYDCMDDVISFPLSRKKITRLKEQEQSLLSNADIVLSSSNYLRKQIIGRGFSGNIITVNNGLNLESFRDKKVKNVRTNKGGNYRILYFGTIAEWFDFKLIFNLLEYFDDLIIELIGPSTIQIPNHPRLKYTGPLPHDDLLDYAWEVDAFIMPFKLSKLVLSVDPVKVYEYIFYCKPVFVVKYEETEKFSDYVCLYSSFEELVDKIKSAKNGLIPINIEKNKTFVKENSWSKRADEIVEIIS